MSTFYTEGDCFATIVTAAEQFENREEERREVARWGRFLEDLISDINELWRKDNEYLCVWKESWFPGIELFMNDLQKLGYHIYLGETSTGAVRYLISLDELTNSDLIGEGEWKYDRQ